MSTSLRRVLDGDSGLTSPLGSALSRGGLLTSLVYEKRPEMDRAVQIRYPPRTVV